VPHLHVVTFEKTRKGEYVPHIIIDDEYFLTREDRIFLPDLFEHLTLQFRQVLFNAMQEQGCLVQQPIERTDVLHDDRFRQAAEFRLFSQVEIFSGVDDDRNIADFRLNSLHQVESIHIGKSEIQHDAVETLVTKCAQGLFGCTDCDRLDVSVTDEFNDALLSGLVVLDYQQTLHAPLNEVFDIANRFAKRFGSHRLVLECNRAHLQSALFFFRDGNDVNGNMPRRLGVLQAVEDAPPVHARQLDVQCNCTRCVLPSQRQAGIAARRYKDFEYAFAGHFHQDLCEREVVFDD